MSSASNTGHVLSNWFVTDINTDVLMRHAGPTLQGLGAQVRAVNLFDMLRQDELQGPSIIIVSCLFPPQDCQHDMGQLIAKYCQCQPNDDNRRSFYDVWAFEAIIGQMDGATVVSICRQRDTVTSGSSPCLVAPLSRIPGYEPKQCNWPADAPLQRLVGAERLKVRVSLDGPCVPQAFLSPTGHFNLVDAVSTATALGIKIIFLGEWDGSLSLGVAHGVMYNDNARFNTPFYKTPEMKPRVRSMKGFTGGYMSYYLYAEEYRRASLERQRMAASETGTSPPPGSMQPHVSLNAACMWFHAQVVALEML